MRLSLASYTQINKNQLYSSESNFLSTAVSGYTLNTISSLRSFLCTRGLYRTNRCSAPLLKGAKTHSCHSSEDWYLQEAQEDREHQLSGFTNSIVPHKADSLECRQSVGRIAVGFPGSECLLTNKNEFPHGDLGKMLTIHFFEKLCLGVLIFEGCRNCSCLFLNIFVICKSLNI